jgi:D-alanyl-D-alanine dipeptidase
VQAALEADGLGLQVYDCFRPLSVQRKFWALVPDRRYVADPSKGSRHNRGAAVDLTLVDAGGQPLDMGTDFDAFNERAHRDYRGLPTSALANRARLEQAMARQGFVGLATEWWHFDAPDWRAFPIE